MPSLGPILSCVYPNRVIMNEAIKRLRCTVMTFNVKCRYMTSGLQNKAKAVTKPWSSSCRKEKMLQDIL